MKKLALESVFFLEPSIKSEIAVLIVHDDRVAELGKMETDLMQPSGSDRHANEGGFCEAL